MGTGTGLKKMAHPVVLIFQKWYLATVDAAGNTIFKTKHYWLGGFTQLQDAAGYTELTMKPKFITWHGRWQAFMGDSMKAKDLVFSIMRSSFLQFYDEWFVYLGGKTEENTYDFRVTGSYRKKNYTIYKGDSSSVVAQCFVYLQCSVSQKHAGEDLSIDLIHPHQVDSQSLQIARGAQESILVWAWHQLKEIVVNLLDHFLLADTNFFLEKRIP